MATKKPNPKAPAKRKAPGKSKAPAKKAPAKRKGPKKKTTTKHKSKAKSKSKTTASGKAKTKAKPTTRGKAPRTYTADEKKRALAIIKNLRREFPDAKCALNFDNALELLVATILAAQCTDARVNIVTETLFKKYTKPEDYVATANEELEEDIRSTGFYRNKTKSIKAACQSLIDNFGGDVPNTMDELLSLAGVGRKTANCLLGNVWNIPGIVVDTHMLRLSKRMGFTDNTNADKVEFDLMNLVPEKEWVMYSHLITSLGRSWCNAKKPMCDDCPVERQCPKLGVAS